MNKTTNFPNLRIYKFIEITKLRMNIYLRELKNSNHIAVILNLIQDPSNLITGFRVPTTLKLRGAGKPGMTQ